MPQTNVQSLYLKNDATKHFFYEFIIFFMIESHKHDVDFKLIQKKKFGYNLRERENDCFGIR